MNKGDWDDAIKRKFIEINSEEEEVTSDSDLDDDEFRHWTLAGTRLVDDSDDDVCPHCNKSDCDGGPDCGDDVELL